MCGARLFKFSLFVRLLVIFLQVLFNHSVPDHNADAFRLPHKIERGSGNVITAYLFDGFSRWDAQYFLHTALYGYTHENTLAFFPLYPLVLTIVSKVLSVIFPFGLSHLNYALISGVFVNCIFTSLACVSLYKLTQTVFHSEIMALTSALLFCINPASIFFSALYSESLFAFVTFCGFWALEKRKLSLALLALSLSGGVRSNGILNAGFLVYLFLKEFLNSYQFASKKKFLHLFKTTLKISLFLIFFSLPFACYQLYCYLLFCTSYLSEQEISELVFDFLTRNDLKVPSEPSKWCNWNIPLSYSYVQSRYWDVGFLQYYTYKQIPNFLLAAPILCVILFSCIKYFIFQRKELWHLGLIQKRSCDTFDFYNDIKVFPYFLHIFFSTVICTLYIHIQVLTRMLCSSSPILYWIAAAAILPHNERIKFKLMKDQTHKNSLIGFVLFLKNIFFKASIHGKIIFLYFLSYFLIGTFLHVNFFPWT